MYWEGDGKGKQKGEAVGEDDEQAEKKDNAARTRRCPLWWPLFIPSSSALFNCPFKSSVSCQLSGLAA